MLKELSNLKIIQKQDKNLNDYYIIFNQESSNEAYFCFSGTVKEGWTDFQTNWNKINSLEFEYEASDKGNKVINIFTHDQSLDVFI